MADQDLLQKFYDIDNLVTVDIEMPTADWDKLRNSEPHFSWRGNPQWMHPQTTKEDIDTWKGHRYDPIPTTSVTLGGSKYPSKQKFTGVWIVKKSFGGSESKQKPSFKLEFGRMSKEMKATASKDDQDKAKKTEMDMKNLIGTNHLTLNNCKQDSSYIKQPLGYEIFHQGGIPWFRCNLVKVSITDPGTKKTLLQGVWVNIEQAREPFIRRNFNNNDQGNLYETEAWFDLTSESFKKGFDSGGFSKYKNQEDLRVAIDQFGKGFDATKKVVDVDQISKVMAMCAIVKHWDGYSNNTFIYNDVVAQEKPTADNGGIKLKMIPSGIDAILRPNDPFEVKNQGEEMTRLAWIIINDAGAKEKLRKICADCTTTFAKNLDGYVKFVERMKVVLKNAGVWTSALEGEINGVVSILKTVPEGMKSVTIN